MTALQYSASGRSWRAALVLGLIWLGLLGLWQMLDAAPWIIVLAGLATLPAAWDFAMGRRAALCLGEDLLRWQSGRTSGEIALARIRVVRFETRVDLSIRVRVLTDTGRRIVLPHDCLPPREVLEQALKLRGVATERHHFGLLPGR